VVAAVLVKEGQKVPVGATLAVIAVEGEDPATVKKSAAAGGAKMSVSPPAKAQPAEAVEAPVATAAVPGSPAGAKQAGPSPGGPPATAGGNGRPRRPAPEEPREPQAPEGDGNGRVKASPLARRIAEQKGIDLADVRGSGPGGRIVQKDVLEFEPGAARAAPRAGEADRKAPAPQEARPATALPQRVPGGKTQVVELSKLRQAIARRLQQSKQTIPHFYETVDIEMDAAEALRARINASLEPEGIRISIGDLIAKAVAATLKIQPVLNSTYDGTTLTRHGDVHLGMAVALDNGLIVPVLRNIDQMGIREIRLRSKDLVDRARAQKLRQDEMSGATFTVSNLGGFGVREFSAIINPPEVGILAISAAGKRAVVAGDGSIVARIMMTVTLSADHRVVDGADSARFLAALKQMLEEPGMMLL
jgi:pyruvate dehydrogenase E2 component (dihydrolipoamide acetyltransferase)